MKVLFALKMAAIVAIKVQALSFLFSQVIVWFTPLIVAIYAMKDVMFVNERIDLRWPYHQTLKRRSHSYRMGSFHHTVAHFLLH